MSTPQTKLYICSGVRINSSYEHSIYFEDAEAQLAYFQSKAVTHRTAYSFIRKSWKLKVDATMHTASYWDYLFFQNSESSRWYYYFINNIEYVNDGTVELSLELDVIQTYMWSYNFNPCFVERQHTVSDEVGEHTVLENLDLGEYTTQVDTRCMDLTTSHCILIQSTVNPNTKANVLGALVNGVYSGMGMWAVNVSHWQGLATLLDGLSDAGKLDGIVSMWMYPQALVTLASGENWNDSSTVCKRVSGVEKCVVTYAKAQGTLDGYTPRNKKLLCYPFNFLYVSNNTGNSAVYKFERFENERCEFNLEGALSPDGTVKLVPQYYNGVPNNHEEGITLSGFPTCAWNADVYKIWLAQNQNQHNTAMTSAGISFLAGTGTAIAGLATGNLAVAGGGVAMGYHSLLSIQNLMAAKQDMSIQPHQAKGSHSVSVNFANNMHTFLVYFKSITAEYAKMIDEYFTMYGYQINRVTVPNIHARPHFTYVKTVGCHIASNLCNEDARKIESIYNNGITFWKNGNNVCNYLLDNSPE